MDNMLKNLYLKGTWQQTIFSLLVFFLCVSVAQGKETVAVFQPDLRAPYDQVFRSIVSGIKEQADFKVSIKKISTDYNQAKLSAWLNKKKVKAIVAFGSRGLEAAQATANGRPVLAAASLLSSDLLESGNAGGISLAADPELMMAELKRLSPSVKKIYAVYSPKHNDWLMQYASKIAEDYGIELKLIQATDLRQAAIQYKSVLNELESERDALWLPLDPITVENRTILPLILRVTWDKNLTVISSNAPHAKRGTLFSTFPKNMEMGQSIAETVNEWLHTGEPKFAVKPLTDLGFAINIRTASHLGIKLNKESLERYDLKFPQE